MFKTDKKSLEEFSFRFSEGDIANFMGILKYLKESNYLTIPDKEAQRAISGLEKIGKLKLDGKVYAFHVFDNCAAKQDFDGGDGVELYLRHGDSLRDFFVPGSRDFTYSAEDAVEYLKSQKKSTIHTGSFPPDSRFLGAHQEYDEDDPITYHMLEDHEIDEFESGGIRVIKLDHLI
jgi:hypothetical protein